MSQPDSMDDDFDDELDQLEGLDDDELERRLAEYAERHPPPRELPPDLSELFGLISDVAVSRRVCETDEIPGHMFDRFEAFGAVIGGMGLVIEARDTELERKVAIKLWKQSGPKAQRALLDEAKMLAKLSHHNVVRVYETGRWGERVFFVMEWIDGVDGHEWLKTPRSWREVRDVFVDAGQGLAAAHEAEIQHRDFKPDNMLVGNGRTVVADFGIADSLRNVENTDPRWGTPAGTPAYMAPERLRGEPGDARSDQFSFCVALWRALYGLRPFAGEEPEELLEAIECGELRTNPDVDVPRWLSEVVRKGLADDPDDRHGDMHELVAALLDDPPGDESETDEPSVGGDPNGQLDGRVLHKPGSRLAFFAALALVCVAVLGVVGYLQAVGRSTPTEPPDLEPAPMPAPPCALEDFEGPKTEVDPVVLEVCRSLRIDHYEAAEMLWEREHAGRLHEVRATATGGRPASTLGVDTLIVARTFLDRAEELERADPAKARVAASHAHRWARQAGEDLGDPQDPRVQDIKRRAIRFAAQATDG